MGPVFYIIIGIIGFAIVSYLVVMAITAHCVCLATMKREDGKQWEVPPEDPLYDSMMEQGRLWCEEKGNCGVEVHTVSGGLNLYGEYFDFGSDKTAIILSGRSEKHQYGYYFAKPYADAGMNILTIDTRAHGKSEGLYNTAGFEESKDAIAWAKYVRDNHGAKYIVFHGICIGAAAGMLASTSPDCPDCVCGLVTEGMYHNFSDSMKNHLIERNKNFPLLMFFIDLWLFIHAKHSMKRGGPGDVIHKLRKPILMLHSKEDIYSLPKYAEPMYNDCGSAEKKLVWFDKGAHSKLRITDTALYDSSIAEFLDKLF